MEVLSLQVLKDDTTHNPVATLLLTLFDDNLDGHLDLRETATAVRSIIQAVFAFKNFKDDFGEYTQAERDCAAQEIIIDLWKLRQKLGRTHVTIDVIEAWLQEVDHQLINSGVTDDLTDKRALEEGRQRSLSESRAEPHLHHRREWSGVGDPTSIMSPAERHPRRGSLDAWTPKHSWRTPLRGSVAELLMPSPSASSPGAPSRFAKPPVAGHTK